MSKNNEGTPKNPWIFFQEPQQANNEADKKFNAQLEKAHFLKERALQEKLMPSNLHPFISKFALTNTLTPVGSPATLEVIKLTSFEATEQSTQQWLLQVNDLFQHYRANEVNELKEIMQNQPSLEAASGLTSPTPVKFKDNNAAKPLTDSSLNNALNSINNIAPAIMAINLTDGSNFHYFGVAKDQAGGLWFLDAKCGCFYFPNNSNQNAVENFKKFLLQYQAVLYGNFPRAAFIAPHHPSLDTKAQYQQNPSSKNSRIAPVVHGLKVSPGNQENAKPTDNSPLSPKRPKLPKLPR